MSTQIIDNRQSYLQSLQMMRSGLKEALDTLAEIKALKGQQLMQQNVMRALAQGQPSEWGGMEQEMVTPADTPEARMARASEAITQTRAGTKAPNILSGILSALNPNVPTFLETTPIEDLITRGMTAEMFRDPMERQKQEAELERTRAYTDYYKRRPAGGASQSTTTSALREAYRNGDINYNQYRQALADLGINLPGTKESMSYVPIQPGSLPGKPLPPKEGEMWRAAPMRTSGFGAPGIETTPIEQIPIATPESATPTEESPYPDYPDAFLENGVWKVIRNGKKFRIED